MSMIPRAASPQAARLEPAIALGELLREHPDLPPANWSIDRDGGPLRGSLQQPYGFDALTAYADTFGGSIRPSCEFAMAGHHFRSHTLSATWREVGLEVTVIVPLGQADPGAVVA